MTEEEIAMQVACTAFDRLQKAGRIVMPAGAPLEKLEIMAKDTSNARC